MATPRTTATPADDNVEFGPQSIRIRSARGSRPVRLQVLAPDHATFRLRRAATSPAPCNVTRAADGQVPPVGMPANVTSRYTVECQGGGRARGAALLTKAPLGDFDYEFEVALGPKRRR